MSDIPTLSIGGGSDFREVIMQERLFLQIFIQTLELDSLPVRHSTQFGRDFGAYEGSFGDECRWFKVSDDACEQVLVSHEPNLKQIREHENIVPFDGLSICLGNRSGRYAFILAYQGLLFLFSESSGHPISVNNQTVTVTNSKSGQSISYTLV